MTWRILMLTLGLCWIAGCSDSPETEEPVKVENDGSPEIPDMPGVAGEGDQKPAGNSQADIPNTSGTKGKPTTMKVGVGGKKVLYVQTYFLNVRSGPGMEYDVVDSVKKGEAVTVEEDSRGWVKMGENRYVGRKHLDTMKPE